MSDLAITLSASFLDMASNSSVAITAGEKYVKGTHSVTSSATSLDPGEVTVPNGYVIIQNTGTQAVLVSLDAGSTFPVTLPVADSNGDDGGVMLAPVSLGATIQVKTVASTSTLSYAIIQL